VIYVGERVELTPELGRDEDGVEWD